MTNVNVYKIPGPTNDFKADLAKELGSDLAAETCIAGRNLVTMEGSSPLKDVSAGNYEAVVETDEIGMNDEYMFAARTIVNNVPVWLVCVNLKEGQLPEEYAYNIYR